MNRIQREIPTSRSQAMWWVIYVDLHKSHRGVATCGYTEGEAISLAEKNLTESGRSVANLKAIRCDMASKADCKNFMSAVKEFYQQFDDDLEANQHGARMALAHAKVMLGQLKKRGEFN